MQEKIIADHPCTGMILLLCKHFYLLLFVAPGLSSKQLSVAPKNEEKVLQQPEKDVEGSGQSSSDKDQESNSKQRFLDESRHDRQHHGHGQGKTHITRLSKEEIEKGGMYEIPNDMESTDDNEKQDGKDDEEVQKGTKHEEFPTAPVDTETSVRTAKDRDIPALYKNTEVLDYAKKYRNQGKVVLDFSRGSNNAKIVVYKYSSDKKKGEPYTEDMTSRMERKRSGIRKKSPSSEKSGHARSVIRKYTFI